MKIKNKFQGIINIISNVMEGYTTALFLADDKNEFMELYCYQSFCKDINKSCIIKNGEGIVGWVMREKKNVLAANFERKTQTLIFYEENEKIKSLMAIPLPQDLGVLYVDSKKSYSFTEEKEKIFSQFADLISNCLYEQKEINTNKINESYYNFFINFERYNKEVLDLSKVSQLMFEYLNISHFFFTIPYHCNYIFFNDEENNKTIPINYKNGSYSEDSLLGWCIKNRKNIMNNNVKTKKSFIFNGKEFSDISNFVGISVCEKKGKEFGAVGFVKKRAIDTFMSEKKFWNQKEVEFLEIFGNKLFEAYMEQNKSVQQ